MDRAGEPLVPRRLRIDLADLVDAFQNGAEGVSAFLDLDTGEVVWVTSEVQRELERIEEDIPEDLVDETAREAEMPPRLHDHLGGEHQVEEVAQGSPHDLVWPVG